MTTPVVQATTWSGRMHCLATVRDALLRLDYPRPIQRLWLVNGPDNLESELGRASEYKGRPVFTQEHGYHSVEAERLRRKEAIATAWADMLELAVPLNHDLLVVEDDIEVPPWTLERLQAAAYGNDAIMATGVASTDGLYPFYTLDHKTYKRWPDPPDAVAEVDATGTFCAYFRAEVFALMREHEYSVKWKMRELHASGKDIHLCWWLREHGQKIVVVPTVRCNHYVLRRPGLVQVNKLWNNGGQ